jgi:hypothetical protein
MALCEPAAALLPKDAAGSRYAPADCRHGPGVAAAKPARARLSYGRMVRHNIEEFETLIEYHDTDLQGTSTCFELPCATRSGVQPTHVKNVRIARGAKTLVSLIVNM